MKNEQIHWFDLDLSLINSNAKWWILDRNNPIKPLLKITQYDGNLIVAGFYKKDNLSFKYNGVEAWLSKEIWNEIQKINNSIKLDDLGISWREFQSDELIEKQITEMVVYINNIKHLSNTKDIVNLLTARGNKSAHKNIIAELNVQLSKINIKINDEIFVSDPTSCTIIGTSAYKKCMTILESIVGYKIKNNEFIPIQCDSYKIANFYDDEDTNITECLSINKRLSDMLKNTAEWLKAEIITHIKMIKPELNINYVCSNELNPFETTNLPIVILED